MFFDKLVLGTVQFGMDYGITNRSGQVSKEESDAILSLAWERGIRRFDTAPGYQSEDLLGRFIAQNNLQNSAKVLTKIPSLAGTTDYRRAVRKTISRSLKKLGCPIDGLFFHRSADAALLKADPVFFSSLLEEFSISFFSVSVYEPSEIENLGTSEFDLAFQFPLNVVDKRFASVDMPIGKRYARSIFLQGLLSAPTDLRSNVGQELCQFHKLYHQALMRQKISPLDYAISFVANSFCADFVLVGVDSILQLNQILSADINERISCYDVDRLVNELDPSLIDPRTWI